MTLVAVEGLIDPYLRISPRKKKDPSVTVNPRKLSRHNLAIRPAESPSERLGSIEIIRA